MQFKEHIMEHVKAKKKKNPVALYDGVMKEETQEQRMTDMDKCRLHLKLFMLCLK